MLLGAGLGEDLGVFLSKFRVANQRMNPDFADSAPKVADFADIWPYFGADKSGRISAKNPP